MYNLLEYSKNYRKTIGSLYNYYRDELNNDADIANFANNNVCFGNTCNINSTILNPAGNA